MTERTYTWTWGGWRWIARRVRVPLSFLIAVLFLWLARPTVLSLAIGSVLTTAGVALRALASGHVRKDRVLTTNGPYAYTRNPLYLGSILIAAAFAIAGWNPIVGVVMVLLFVVIYLPIIRGEEEFLTANFPEYAGYKQRVPRLFPRLRAGAEGHSAFSMELYRRHREYNAALGTLAMLLLLIFKMLFWKVR